MKNKTLIIIPLLLFLLLYIFISNYNKIYIYGLASYIVFGQSEQQEMNMTTSLENTKENNILNYICKNNIISYSECLSGSQEEYSSQQRNECNEIKNLVGYHYMGYCERRKEICETYVEISLGKLTNQESTLQNFGIYFENCRNENNLLQQTIAEGKKSIFDTLQSEYEDIECSKDLGQSQCPGDLICSYENICVEEGSRDSLITP